MDLRRRAGGRVAVKISAQTVSPLLSKQMDAALSDVAESITGIMRDEVGLLKEDYRRQVLQAGMGPRMAKTWRGETYPKAGHSLNPAGYIWSAAPEIVDSFVRGASIRPVNGAKWLWIPTKNVPRRRRAGNYVSSLGKRSRGTAMTPEEVELHFNAELSVVIEGGKGFAFIDVVSGIRTGYRPATAGRLKGRRGMAARKAKPVLMFNLRRGVKMPRLFELQAPADKAAARVARRIQARWG
jgi:hypothetical protein